ncbi:CotH kinase family protein [Christensenellaceae bacterium OttesenSCG-928-K19]|nr:CotH kinase family protein [Christensenellaceae bacterium OttesenSCG-928-K19]
MKTTITSGYKTKLLGILLLAGVLVLFAVILLPLPDSTTTQQELVPDQPVRREGCTCQLDHNLPIVVIDTEGQDISTPPPYATIQNGEMALRVREKSEKFRVNLSIYEQDGYGYTCTCGVAQPTLTQSVLISLRGQSSLRMPKNQYTLNFVDEDGVEQPQSVLGMPSHDQWVLNGSYVDKSLVRNALAFDMAEQTMDYAPGYEYCEVLLNSSGGEFSFDRDYYGVYLMVEKIERGANRVDIDRSDPRVNDISFIIARDKVKVGDNILYTDWSALEDDFVIIGDTVRQRTVIVCSYPGSATLTEEYAERITGFLNDFEYALESAEFKDINDGYRGYIDVDSFIELAMINELFKNIDGGEISTYFYKDQGGKMNAGPLWDFDLTLGNTDTEEVNEPTGFRIINTIWFERLFQDPYFAKRYQSIYRFLRAGEWQTDELTQRVDGLVDELGPAIDRNLERWYTPEAIQQANVRTDAISRTEYDAEIEEIKLFLTERLDWMDDNLQIVQRIERNTID